MVDKSHDNFMLKKIYSRIFAHANEVVMLIGRKIYIYAHTFYG